nr:hypothetical protein [Mesorhizobium alhagi]
MRKYIAATLSILVAIGPASALDLGLGGKAGGVGVGANVSVGSKGASVGVGANLGEPGGADAGASAGTSNGSIGATVGGSGKVGGVGIGTNLGAGSKGASLGFGANVDGVGGANLGTSIGRSGASLGVGANLGGAGGATSGTSSGKSGASLGGGSNSGSASSRGSTGARAGAGAALGNSTRGAPPGSWSAGASGVGTSNVISPTAGLRHSIVLPPILRPSRAGRGKSIERAAGYSMLRPARLRAKPGTPGAVVRACRQAIVSGAKPFGAVRVQAVSAGLLNRHRRGALTAPIEVRIEYATRSGIEVRQARVKCRLDAAGRVIAVI